MLTMMRKRRLYNAAKAYYDKGGKWGKGSYNRAGRCCFIGAAAAELDMTTDLVQHYLGCEHTAQILRINDASESKESALNAIAIYMGLRR